MENKKWLSMLIAIVISVTLWVYVVAVENPEGEVELNNIPVTFSGEDVLRENYNLILTDSNTASGVTLKFHGKLSDLNKLREKRSELGVTINVSHLRSAQDYQLTFDLSDVTLPTSLSYSDISLRKTSPSEVEITLENLLRTKVPVKVQQNVVLAEHYMTGTLSKNYEEISVEGPESLVSQISYAQAILERENVNQSIDATLPLTLIDKSGNIVSSPTITCSTSEIAVSLPVLMYKEVPLAASFVYGGGITESNVVHEITPKSVRLSGEAAALEPVQSISLSNIDLASLPTNSEVITRSIPVPAGCTLVSGEAQEAEVSVQIKNKTIKRVRVSSSNFQYLGLPDDMAPVPKTTVLSVVVRVDEADADRFTEDNIRVQVDFTGLSLSKNMTVPVKIYVDGFEGAGVVTDSEYSILVDVVPVEELDSQTQ